MTSNPGMVKELIARDIHVVEADFLALAPDSSHNVVLLNPFYLSSDEEPCV